MQSEIDRNRVSKKRKARLENAPAALLSSLNYLSRANQVVTLYTDGLCSKSEAKAKLKEIAKAQNNLIQGIIATL